MQKITPFLWYDGRAEEAMNLYVSAFKNSRIVRVTRCGDAGPGPKGSVMSATFELEGQQFHALNGGPMFTFSPAISLFVSCESQEEIDALCGLLSAGGEVQQCGWVKDRFGVSWQLVPSTLGAMLGDPDPARSGRVMAAMLGMKKLDIARLTAAHEGRG